MFDVLIFLNRTYKNKLQTLNIYSKYDYVVIMSSLLKNWKKLENEAGYPYYVDETTGRQQNDHPKFMNMMESVVKYSPMKYSVYRTAFQIFTLQKHLEVPPLRITSGVFARHQLSLSESSLSLDTAELEAVLADIYFAAGKEGLYKGDVDLIVDLFISLVLNVFDKDRKNPVKVLAAKVLLITLSEESVSDKWAALAHCCADHNGCVSPRRLTTLMTHLVALPLFLGDCCNQLQSDVDACFAKSAGMLGVTAHAVAEWGIQHCISTRWMLVMERITASRNISEASALCANCAQPLIQVLKFKCSKCNDVYLCENCYLYDSEIKSVNGHKKTHPVLEVINNKEKNQTECISFMKKMKRFFFCTKTKRKTTVKKPSKKRLSIANKNEGGTLRKRKEGKPVIFTSTVGKASGNSTNNLASMLQDIIAQLESQNQALKELSDQLQQAANYDDNVMKFKVETHYNQISAQINRLKIVKENLLQDAPITAADVTLGRRPQAFDIFSPIRVEDKKQSKDTEKSQPRVLSLDSGNFSVISKRGDSHNIMTVSGDALKPVVVHATSDSISAVSMNDISSWYHADKEGAMRDNRNHQSVQSRDDRTARSISALDQRTTANIRTIESSDDKRKELNADLDTVLDRLQEILTNNFAMDDSCFDNTQLRETANEMEGLLGSLIRGVEQRATLNATRGMV